LAVEGSAFHFSASVGEGVAVMDSLAVELPLERERSVSKEGKGGWEAGVGDAYDAILMLV
jgi:hypothetical protein